MCICACVRSLKVFRGQNGAKRLFSGFNTRFKAEVMFFQGFVRVIALAVKGLSIKTVSSLVFQLVCEPFPGSLCVQAFP